MSNRWLLPLLPLVLASVVRADGPADNAADKVRPVPPKGVKVPDADRTALQSGADTLGKQIDGLRDSLKAQPALLALLPDVLIYEKAVRSALVHDEFYNVKEFAVARKLLEQGLERARQLSIGKHPMEYGDRISRTGICLEDRRFGSAVWARRAGLVSTRIRHIGFGSMCGATDAAKH